MNLNSAGIYSMLSAFFLVIVLVFIVIALAYLNLFVSSQESRVYRGTQPFELASDIKNKIIEAKYCFSGKITEDKLDPDKNIMDQNTCWNEISKASQEKIAGFSVERIAHLDCLQLKQTAGSFDNCAQKFVFFSNVESDYKKCLGKIVVCMNMEKETETMPGEMP